MSEKLIHELHIDEINFEFFNKQQNSENQIQVKH